MALHTEELKETSGNRKKINVGAYSMVFDNLQRSNYRYPIKSTLRELVCNGIDAIKERVNAVAILSGKAKVSDFYYVPGSNPEVDEAMEQSPGLYSDSQFDRDYYSLEHLEKTAQVVAVQYMESSVLNRDVLIVSDTGVGLGGKRLEGYFDLAFSTKRLNLDALGKFGLGSKVPLSTGVPYFTMLSRYNGREVVFNVYSESYEGVLSAINLETNEVHQKHVMSEESNSYVYYSRATSKPNGTEIRVQIKKHHKDDVLSAVQNQLLYFPGVTLEVVDEHYQVKQTYPVQADILYEDDHIIISDNNQFSKPHIVINNVSYGYLDYLEMEIEEKSGNVGIKVAPNEVEVTHSREAVIWSQITKDTILSRFKEVKEIAGSYISNQLIETDYIKWVRLCQNINNRGGSEGSNSAKIVRAFSGIVTLTDLVLKYAPDPTIKYSSTINAVAKNCKVDRMSRIQVRKGEVMVEKLQRAELSKGTNTVSWDTNVQPIMVKESKYSFRKDMYLTMIYPQGYLVISSRKGAAQDAGDEDDAPTLFADLEDNNRHFELIKASEGVMNYDTLEVPESFSIKDSDEDKEVEIQGDEPKVVVSTKERRKLEGKIVAQTPRVVLDGKANRKDGCYLYENYKLEITPAMLDQNKQLYYGTKEYEVLLYLAASLTRSGEPHQFRHRRFVEDDTYTHYKGRCTSWGEDAAIQLLQISKDNEAYFAQDWAHITTFFSSIDKGIITMDNKLIQWNTARLVNEQLPKLEFLQNFSSIDPEVAKTYEEIRDFWNTHYKDYKVLIEQGYTHATQDIFDSLLIHLDNVTQLHVMTAQGADEESIGAKAQNLFPQDPKADTIKGAVGVDLEIYQKLNELLEYAQPIQVMLNMNYKLTERSGTLSLEEELEIKGYIAHKNHSHQ